MCATDQCWDGVELLRPGERGRGRKAGSTKPTEQAAAGYGRESGPSPTAFVAPLDDSTGGNVDNTDDTNSSTNDVANTDGAGAGSSAGSSAASPEAAGSTGSAGPLPHPSLAQRQQVAAAACQALNYDPQVQRRRLAATLEESLDEAIKLKTPRMPVGEGEDPLDGPLETVMKYSDFLEVFNVCWFCRTWGDEWVRHRRYVRPSVNTKFYRQTRESLYCTVLYY